TGASTALVEYSGIRGSGSGGAAPDQPAKLDGMLHLGIMSPIAAVALSSIAIAILAIAIEERRKNDPVDADPTQLMVLLSTLFSLPVLIGYVFGGSTAKMVAPY